MWELARSSAEKVAVVAIQLSAKEAHNLSVFPGNMRLVRRLSDLSAYLTRISMEHDKHGPNQSAAHGRADEFLKGLEHLCTYNVSHGPPHFRNLGTALDFKSPNI
jgi:hypothetical protein